MRRSVRCRCRSTSRLSALQRMTRRSPGPVAEQSLSASRHSPDSRLGWCLRVGRGTVHRAGAIGLREDRDGTVPVRARGLDREIPAARSATLRHVFARTTLTELARPGGELPFRRPLKPRVVDLQLSSCRAARAVHLARDTNAGLPEPGAQRTASHRQRPVRARDKGAAIRRAGRFNRGMVGFLRDGPLVPLRRFRNSIRDGSPSSLRLGGRYFPGIGTAQEEAQDNNSRHRSSRYRKVQVQLAPCITRLDRGTCLGLGRMDRCVLDESEQWPLV